MEKTLSWHVDVPHGGVRRLLPHAGVRRLLPHAGVRRLLARSLRLTARALARWSRTLAVDERRPTGDPVLEFYAEAGAPEGALYADGELVAILPGVSRL